MFLAVQFPIADARRFSRDPPPFTGPEWSAPRADFNPEFIRHFGAVTLRTRGADAAWVDEYAYCRAARALRFGDLRTARLGRAERSLVPMCAFRRFFHDGRAVARVEVGLGHDQRRGREPHGLDDEDLMAIVAGFFSLPTHVAPRNGPSPARELILQGPHLARLYAASSVRASRDAADGLVRAGAPTVVVEFPLEAVVGLPRNALDVSHVTEDAEIAILFSRVETPYGTVPTWFIGSGVDANRNTLRSLRLCLFRLHAEQQVLDTVLTMLARREVIHDAGSPAGDALETYLNEATRMLTRDHWRGTSGSQILYALDATANVANSAQRTILGQRLQGARLQIARKVASYQEQRAATLGVTTITVMGDYVTSNEQKIYGGTFHGPVVNVVAAEKIEESFKVVTASDGSADLKENLATLHTEVAKLVEAMTAEGVGDPDEVVNQLETFSKQAVEKRPLRAVLKSTGQGLIDAAKFVAQSAGPVAAAITAIMKAVGAA